VNPLPIQMGNNMHDFENSQEEDSLDELG